MPSTRKKRADDEKKRASVEVDDDDVVVKRDEEEEDEEEDEEEEEEEEEDEEEEEEEEEADEDEDKQEQTAAAGDRKRSARSEDTSKSPPKRQKVSWTAKEDDALLKAVVEERKKRETSGEEEEEEDWDEIAKSCAGKSPVQCLKRYMKLNRDGGNPSGEAAVVEKEARKPKKAKKESDPSKWTAEESELLKKLVEEYKDSKFFSRCNNDAFLGETELTPSVFLFLFFFVCCSCGFIVGYFCKQLHRDGTTLRLTLRAKQQ